MNTLKEGDLAPHFSLLNQDEKLISLENFKGKKVLVYFYPKALTPGCTTQACGLRDSKTELESKGERKERRKSYKLSKIHSADEMITYVENLEKSRKNY